MKNRTLSTIAALSVALAASGCTSDDANAETKAYDSGAPASEDAEEIDKAADEAAEKINEENADDELKKLQDELSDE